jgi:hypothetical protein
VLRVYRTYLLAGLASAVLLPAAFAAAPPPPSLRAAAIQRLIEQLGDRDYRVRDLAERRLQAEGKTALPLLRKATAHSDPEVRRRVVRLIPGMEAAILFAPRRVTFTVRNQPLNKVLDELSKASGYKVMNQAGVMFFPGGAPAAPAAPGAVKEKTFSYEFVNEPFWNVVERLCRDAKLTVQQSWGDDFVRLYPTVGHAPHVARSGPFFCVAQNFQLYRNVDLSTTKPDGPTAGRSESLTFNFLVFAEPRLPFMGMGEPRLESAYDDLRNSMLLKTVSDPSAGAWGPGGVRFIGRRYYGGNYKQLTMHVGVNLERRSEKASTLKVLRGVVPMTILVEQKPMLITDKILSAKGVKKTLGELEFNIQEVKKMPNNQVQVRFTVTKKGGNDYTWQNSLYNRLELSDDKGNKFNIWGTSWGGSGANVVNLTLTYGTQGVVKVGTPTKFAFMHWETKQYDVAFEFRNVPLP